jgi:hypothetical protein
MIIENLFREVPERENGKNIPTVGINIPVTIYYYFINLNHSQEITSL